MLSPKVTPKDFFLWAGAMVALYGSVIALIALVFQYIDYVFPDPLAYYYSDPFSSSIRFSMASLIVLVPVAIVLLRLVRNDIARVPEKNDLWVRRWALVLTVFIAGSAVVGDLIALINSFLGGDLSTRFVLKVLVLLLVAIAVFLHFVADLRGYWTLNPKRARTVGYTSGGLVLATIISGFFIMGTPGDVRLMRYDSEKVSALQNIQWQVVNYWQQKEKLPMTLTELEDPISGWQTPLDAQTDNAYRYEKTGDKSFKLCATFNKESQNDTQRTLAYPGEFGFENESWKHGVGEVCFERTIDPDRYPTYTKPAR